MDDINRALNRRKNSFLDSVENDVRAYIESTGKQCIAVVEKSPQGGIYRTWEVHLDDDLTHFCKVLYKFVRKQTYNGHALDSALTDPISERVETAYQEFYQSESDAISNGMLAMLAADQVKLENFMDRISAIALRSFSSRVKKQVVHMVVDQVKTSVEQGTLHTVGNQIGHLAATTAGSQVATIVAHLLLKLLAANMAKIVAKVLASAFLKKILAVLVKKFVLTAVTTAVLHFLATHVGAAVGGSTIMWIVLPLLAAYIGYKIATFPEKLGEKVSKRIREELSEKFEVTNTTILEKIFEKVFGENELVQVIAKNEDFQSMLHDLGKKLQSGEPNEKQAAVAMIELDTSSDEFDTSISDEEEAPRRQSVVALYSFNSDRPGDLDFKKGDTITILQRTPSTHDWWIGTLGSKTGSFPANYVDVAF